MGATAVEVADFVGFELKAVYDPGLFCFGFLILVGGAFLFLVFDFGGS